jgi:hypothetical protein
MMPRLSRRGLLVCTTAAMLAGCATSAKIETPTDIPSALALPSSQRPWIEAFAVGVQIYECDAAQGATKPGAWKFVAPEATLTDSSGRTIGKHYAGPTWEAVDGSLVVGQVRSSDPGPDSRSIPWLALTVKSSSGQGVLTPTTGVLRVRTSGGIAPNQPCDLSNAKQVVRVPYKATYYFYRAAA